MLHYQPERELRGRSEKMLKNNYVFVLSLEYKIHFIMLTNRRVQPFWFLPGQGDCFASDGLYDWSPIRWVREDV